MGVRCRFAAIAAAQLMLLAFCSNAFASDKCSVDDVQPGAATAYDAAMALMCDMNEMRAENGLRPLSWDWRLWFGAQNHASDMAARHYFAHVSPEGRGLFERIQPTGYIPAEPTWTLSENLGFGTNVLSTPQAIVRGWMNSPPHRENLLDPEVDNVGIGMAFGSIDDGGRSGIIYVVDFGTRGAATAPTTRVAASRPVRSRGSTGSVKSRGRAGGRARRR